MFKKKNPKRFRVVYRMQEGKSITYQLSVPCTKETAEDYLKIFFEAVEIVEVVKEKVFDRAERFPDESVDLIATLYVVEGESPIIV